MIRGGCLLFLLLPACAAPVDHIDDCYVVCHRTVDECQTFDFVGCYEYCETLDPDGVEAYDRCTQCYVEILCDNSRYAELCYPGCAEG